MKFKLIIVTLLLSCALLAQPTLQEEQDYEFSQQLMSKSMYDLAAVQFIKYTEHYPYSSRSPQALINAAICYENLDSLKRAAECYYNILLKYPQSELTDQAMYKHGQLLIKNQEYASGAASLERMLVFTPKSPLVPLAQLEAGKAYLQLKEFPKALDAVQIIIEQYPDHQLRPQAHLLIAKIRGAQGYTDVAFNELSKITGNNLDNETTQQALLTKAELYEKAGRYSLSDSTLKQLVESNASSDYVLQAGLRYAVSRQHFGDFQGAQEIVARLQQRNINGFFAARLYMVAGDNAFALNEMQNALQQYSACNPDDLDVFWQHALNYRLGLVHAELNDFNAANEFFNKISYTNSDADPGIAVQALMAQAKVLEKADRPLEAVTLLQKSLEQPVFAEHKDIILFTMGTIQESGLNDWAGARNSYAAIQSAILNSRRTNDAQLAIAHSYEKEKDLAQALKSYKRYLSIYPASVNYDDIQHKVDILSIQVPQNQNSGPMPPMFGSLMQSTEQLLHYARDLADNYHHYNAALSIFYQILDQNPSNESINPVNILADIAQCHSRLAGIYQDSHQPVLAKAQQDSVNQIYQFTEQHFSDSPEKWAILKHKISTDLNFIEQYQVFYLDTMLVKIPEQYQDHSWYKLDLLRAKLIMQFMPDSTDWLALQKANLICGNLLEKAKDTQIRNETLLLNANILYKLAETDSALGILSQLGHSNSHTGVLAQYLKANILHDIEQNDQALAIFSNLAEYHAYSELGKQSAFKAIDILLNRGEFDKAESLLTQFRDHDPSGYLPSFFFKETDQDWLWSSVKLEQAREDDLKAIELLRQYIYTSGTRKHHPKALLMLGDLAREHHNIQIAISHYNELVSNFPQDTLAQVALINTAQIFYDMGDYKTSLDLYTRIQSQLTGDMKTMATARQIICEINLGNLPRAKQLSKQFSKTYDARNYEADFLYEEGLYHIRQKDFDLAEDALKDLSKKYDDIPEGGKGQLGLARMYVITGKPEEALEILTRIPDKYDDPIILATAYLNLGDFYYENRQLPQCISACERVIELVDTGMLHKDALNLLIKTYDQYKFWDKSISLIREFILKYPNDPDLMIKRIQIGTMLHDLKDYDRSISHLKQLKPLVSASEEPEVQYWIARSYLDKGDLEQAIVEFLKVRYLSKPTKLPWGVTALYEAGNAYHKLGNSDKAIELLQQVVRERGISDNIGRAASERIKAIQEEIQRESNG